MTEPSVRSMTRARQRQYLLLAGLAGVIGGTAFLSVQVTSRKPTETPSRPVTTQILAPGAQVDPKDAWRGQADAHLKAIEQNTRELDQRHSQLDERSKEMMVRLRRLERDGLTPLPPPPVSAPALKPDFGPDKRTDVPIRDPLLQRLPPPPPGAPPSSSPPLGVPGAGQSLLPTAGIVSVVLNEPTPSTEKSANPAQGPTPRDTRRYLPSGSFARAIMLGGLDAPTGGQAQRNPQPVVLKLLDHAVLPNQFRSRVKECFVVAAGFGDVSAERAYLRTETLSCVNRDGTALDVPLKGYVAGEDGKAGLRGRLVSKQGQILANALLAGVAGGIGHAFRMGATTLQVSPLGTTSTVDPERQLQAGLGVGMGRALDRLAQYYISLAEKVFPVIEVDAGRHVDVVVTQGMNLGGPLDTPGADANAPPRARDDADEPEAELPLLQQRTPKRTPEDPDEP